MVKLEDIGRRPPPFVCTRCKANQCEQCVDVLRALYSDRMICKCRRKNHNGEPMDQQIADPTTGDVYAPGLVVREDGTIDKTS